MRDDAPPPEHTPDDPPVRTLVLHARPEIRDLLRRFGIPRPVAAAYLREAAEVVGILWHRIPDPHRWLLDRLETRCRAYRDAAMEGDHGPSEP